MNSKRAQRTTTNRLLVQEQTGQRSIRARIDEHKVRTAQLPTNQTVQDTPAVASTQPNDKIRTDRRGQARHDPNRRLDADRIARAQRRDLTRAPQHSQGLFVRVREQLGRGQLQDHVQAAQRQVDREPHGQQLSRHNQQSIRDIG